MPKVVAFVLWEMPMKQTPYYIPRRSGVNHQGASLGLLGAYTNYPVPVSHKAACFGGPHHRHVFPLLMDSPRDPPMFIPHPRWWLDKYSLCSRCLGFLGTWKVSQFHSQVSPLCSFPFYCILPFSGPERAQSCKRACGWDPCLCHLQEYSHCLWAWPLS